jgi:hypothetical protein
MGARVMTVEDDDQGKGSIDTSDRPTDPRGATSWWLVRGSYPTLRESVDASPRPIASTAAQRSYAPFTPAMIPIWSGRCSTSPRRQW